jgi:hypothetical protein
MLSRSKFAALALFAASLALYTATTQAQDKGSGNRQSGTSCVFLRSREQHPAVFAAEVAAAETPHGCFLGPRA